jgi:hypothetical protein
MGVFFVASGANARYKIHDAYDLRRHMRCHDNYNAQPFSVSALLGGSFPDSSSLILHDIVYVVAAKPPLFMESGSV